MDEIDPLAINERKIGPEISLIPIKHKQLYEEYNPEKEGLEIIHKVRSPRQQVRLVSKEEADKAAIELQNTIIKRKSLPLEKCPICKKFFRRMKTHLQKHTEIHEDANSPLTCHFCSKVFNTGSNLSIHMRTHTGDKPYICSICQKGFAQSCNLVNHMRIHTGERPYKCPHCDRAFTQSGNLNNHIRLHTDEKPFKCHFCEKAFTQSGNLNSHIKNNHKYMTEKGGSVHFVATLE